MAYLIALAGEEFNGPGKLKSPYRGKQPCSLIVDQSEEL
jgi:hypothetical protein